MEELKKEIQKLNLQLMRLEHDNYELLTKVKVIDELFGLYLHFNESLFEDYPNLFKDEIELINHYKNLK